MSDICWSHATKWEVFMMVHPNFGVVNVKTWNIAYLKIGLVHKQYILYCQCRKLKMNHSIHHRKHFDQRRSGYGSQPGENSIRMSV